MRRGLHRYVLVMGLIFLCPLLRANEMEVNLHVWNRYTAVIKDGKTKESQFAVKRGYFRINYKFTDNIAARFNLDFFSSDGFHDGAGLKLKYAYVDFKKLLPIPESKLTFGLLKTYFGTIYDWKYISIQKALEDKEKVISSTDYGIAIFGYIPNGYGEYAISVLNGEGYKKTGENVNINPAYVANLRVIPIPGITIGGSLLYEKSGFIGTLKLDFDKRLLYAGVLKIAYRPLDIQFEYLYSEKEPYDKDPKKSSGFMVMPIFRLRELIGKDIELLARYDKWDPDVNALDDAHSRITMGFNWFIMRNMPVQINWERTLYENDEKESVDKIMAQLKWDFTTKIKGE